jgi:HD-like signal output (HDOD) protein
MVAGLCYVVAKRCTQVNPDTALLAGLLHGVGKLYILTRALKQPSLWQDKPTYNQIVRDWHANIAKAILENWEVSEEVVDAVADYENIGRSHVGFTDLTDVLTVASLLAAFREFPESIELNLQGVKGFERMQLDQAGVLKLLAESDKEVGSLKAALGA